MALDYDKVDVSAGINTATRLNAELEKIRVALQDGLSRTGSLTSPNEMSTDMDMGGNDVLNAGAVQCSSILVGGDQIASVAELAAEAARAEVAMLAAENARISAELAQYYAELAAASLALPTISPGDATKALVVNATEDGYEYSAPSDPAVAISAAITDQTTAEAGVDNTELMTPLSTLQAVAAHVKLPVLEGTTSTMGTAKKALLADVYNAVHSGSQINPSGVVTCGDLKTAIVDGSVKYTRGVRSKQAGIFTMAGNVDITGSTTTIVFPTAFPTKCVSIVTTASSGNQVSAFVTALTRFNAEIKGGPNEGILYWVAYGY